jgi:hypothetical protein
MSNVLDCEILLPYLQKPPATKEIANELYKSFLWLTENFGIYVILTHKGLKLSLEELKLFCESFKNIKLGEAMEKAIQKKVIILHTRNITPSDMSMLRVKIAEAVAPYDLGIVIIDGSIKMQTVQQFMSEFAKLLGIYDEYKNTRIEKNAGIDEDKPKIEKKSGDKKDGPKINKLDL